MSKKSKVIAVIGGREASEYQLELASDVGRGIAKKGAVLLSGGMGGIMEAACKGAKEAGGVTIGIIPGSNRNEANDYVDFCIATGIGIARNAILMHTCDGAVAIGGRYGTLSEMAYAGQLDKPLVSLDSWVFDEKVICAKTADEALQVLFQMIG